LQVGKVNQIQDRDQVIYRAWVDGARQSDIAERYGVSQQAISQAIGRAVAAMPAQDKAHEVKRSLDLVDELVQVYAPRARKGNAAATREVRGLLALRGRYLGIDRREVDVSVHGQVDHRVYEPGPPLAEVLDQFRQQGLLTATATRLDQDGKAT
jgi:predicted DNA-binding protein YlxM (UPF0122 family)